MSKKERIEALEKRVKELEDRLAAMPYVPAPKPADWMPKPPWTVTPYKPYGGPISNDPIRWARPKDWDPIPL